MHVFTTIKSYATVGEEFIEPYYANIQTLMIHNSTGPFENFSIHCQVLVQLGDILDRGEDEIAILSLLKSLDIQAKAQGGAVFQVCVMLPTCTL